MKIDKLEEFCSVGRNMNFSKAADECHTAQSAISLHIRQLEEEVGFQIFERSTRKVSFTEAGYSFYKDCLSILENIENAQSKAAAISAGKKSTITVGIEGLIQSDIRIAMMRKFEAMYPEVKVIPVCMNLNDKYEQLSNGEVDVVFDIPRYYTLNRDIKAVGLIRNEHILMVSKDHPLADKRVVTKKDLSEHVTFLGGVSNIENYLMQQYIEYLRSDHYDTKKVRYVPDQNVATMMVALGQGGNILPRERTPILSRDVFSAVELEEPFYIESAWLYSKKNKNPILEKFIEMVDA